MITLELLADQLDIPLTNLHRAQSSQEALRGVRLWPTISVQDPEYYAHLVDVRDSSIEKALLDSHFSYILLDDKDPCFDDLTYLFIPNTDTNAREVLERIAGIFEYYANWIEQLFMSSVSKRDIGDLLNISYPVFKNPLYVVDSAFILIACTRDIPVEHPSEQWRSISEEGMLNPAIVRRISFSQIEELDRLDHASFMQTVDTEAGRNIVSHIEKNGARIANLAIVECDTPLSNYHLAFADYLMQCIRFVIDSENNFIENRGTLYDKWLIALLEGGGADPRQIVSHLKRLHWAVDDTYQIAVIRFNARRRFGTNALSYYWPALAQMTMGHKCFIFKESIVILFHYPKKERLPRFEDPGFLNFIRLNGLSCTFSSLYYSIFDSKDFLTQAIRFQHYTSAEEPIRTYLECLPSTFFDQFKKSEGWKTNVHPIVRMLESYDEKHDVHLVETLFHYLLSERSLKQCSELLHIHRSTLVYRINKIKKEFDVDFSDERLRLSLLISSGLSLSLRADRLIDVEN